MKIVYLVFNCAGLTLAKQPDTHPAARSHSTRMEVKIGWKSLWIEAKTWRSLTSYRHGQNRFNLGENQFPLLPIKIGLHVEKDKI